jgi:hypothetical protein
MLLVALVSNYVYLIFLVFVFIIDEGYQKNNLIKI